MLAVTVCVALIYFMCLSLALESSAAIIDLLSSQFSLLKGLM